MKSFQYIIKQKSKYHPIKHTVSDYWDVYPNLVYKRQCNYNYDICHLELTFHNTFKSPFIIFLSYFLHKY